MISYGGDKSEFGLALIEKAYMNLYRGSCVSVNPSIEMAMILNWIPETVSFDDVSNKDNLWSRLLQNFRDQNIILCLQGFEDSELFCVLDLFESSDGARLIQCKTPIANSVDSHKHISAHLPTKLDYILKE